MLAVLKDAKDTKCAISVSLFLPCMSNVFWKLDARNRLLIEYGEQSLMFFDKDSSLSALDGTPHDVQIFHSVKHCSANDRPWTYRNCCNAVFLIVRIVGVASAIVLASVRQGARKSAG